MTENDPYKAEPARGDRPVAFAAFETYNWTVEAKRITHRDYADKRYLQAGWIVIAPPRRGCRHRNLNRRSCHRTDRLALDFHDTATNPNQASARRIIEA